jgi:hypothetical protein
MGGWEAGETRDSASDVGEEAKTESELTYGVRVLKMLQLNDLS